VKLNSLEIAIDFDGTCVYHAFPKVGRDIGAVPVLKKLVAAGHKLILFTMRDNDKGKISPITQGPEDGGLQDAVNWFLDNNIPLYGVQSNPTQELWTKSPKCYAHLYIDDAALGIPLVQDEWDNKPVGRPYVDWIKVEELLQQKGLI